jgi:multidrug efflux pump subunit AcrA (membrane-fusion protein)
LLPDGKRKRNRAGILGAVCLTIIAVAGAFYWYRAEEAGPVRGSRGGGGRAAAPVSVAVASKQDVSIYLTGIGSVQAYFTIDIRAKVDGELQEVLFTEGQHVKKGDVLAKIDPRLYQAALDQAKAKRAQDGVPRPRRIPVPAGRAAAAGRFPHRAGDGDAGGRERRDHGILGRYAAGTPDRPDRRHHPDDR